MGSQSSKHHNKHPNDNSNNPYPYNQPSNQQTYPNQGQSYQQQSQQSQHPIYIAGRPSPKYIRSITVQNKSSQVIVVSSRHKSGQIHSTVIQPNNLAKVEKLVQVETYETVDAINGFQFALQNGNQIICQGDDSDVGSIQARQYVIGNDFKVLRNK